jgi:hypothetical protein
LDESADITDICQLTIFFCTIDENFEIKKEFLKLQPLTTGTKGSDVFEAINKLFLNLLRSRNALVVTDGAKSIVGCKTGLRLRF